MRPVSSYHLMVFGLKVFAISFALSWVFLAQF